MLFHTLNELDLFLKKTPFFAFYGLGNIGTALFSYIELLGLSGKVRFFLLTDNDEFPDNFCGKNIYSVSNIPDEEKKTPIFIATAERNHREIEGILEGIDVKSYYSATDKTFKSMRDSFLQRMFEEKENDTVICEISNMQRNRSVADILFISPPYWDVYSPFSAVPSLVGELNRRGIVSSQFDLGIEAFRYLLSRIWKFASFQFMGYGFYKNAVCEYKENPYASYAEYYNSLWFFHGRDFLVDTVKLQYQNLNEIQRGVIDLFYQNILSLDDKNINFNTLKSIHDAIQAESWNVFLEMLLSRGVLSAFADLPDLIGISVTSAHQFLPACFLAELLKQVKPNVKIIFGGSCADLFVESLYPSKNEIYDYFDYIIVGEGETAVWKLIRYIKGEKLPIEEIPNLVTIDEMHHVSYNTRLLENVEELPLADYSGLDLNKYMAPRPILPYQASRGCHYGFCAFCNHNERYRHNYRMKSKGKIIREIAQLSRLYDIHDIQFVDEAIRPDHFSEIIDEMEENDLQGIRWFCYSRVSRQYTSELLKRAYQCGCRMVMFGVETFNQRLLTFIKKGIDANTSKNCLQLFHENGIMTYAWLMCNLPSETVEEVREDIAEVERNIACIDAGSVGPFSLEINTDMYRDPKKYNICSIDLEQPSRFSSCRDGNLIDKEEMLSCYRNEYAPLLRKHFFYRERYQVYFGAE